MKGLLATLRELMGFLWAQKLWWLIPMILILLLFAALIALGSSSGAGPFIYTLF